MDSNNILLTDRALEKQLRFFFEEDDLSRNLNYVDSLPRDFVEGKIYIKSEMILAGLPWFIGALKYLGDFEQSFDIEEVEGCSFQAGESIDVGRISFATALTAERIALNLLQRASSIATWTHQFVNKGRPRGIKILDTRKTTPGLRSLEKYAVVKGGGFNHRLGQTDLWMVKDNHKTFFGGVGEAVRFFRNKMSMYTPLLVEVHNLQEIEEAYKCGIRHLMLDNFSPEQVKEAIAKKEEGTTFEVSGGITLDTIDEYLIDGVDAISIGSLTYGAPMLDLSFKYSK